MPATDIFGRFRPLSFGHRFRVRRRAPSSRDASGGRVDAYVEGGEVRPCHREDANPTNVPDLATTGSRVRVVLYVPPPDPGLREGDIVLMLDPGGATVEQVPVVRQRSDGHPASPLYRIDGGASS